jgi:hypothetical protein
LTDPTASRSTAPWRRWAYVTDVTNDPAWLPNIIEGTETSEGLIGTGTVWHARFKPAMGISEGLHARGDVRADRRQVMGDIGPMHRTLTYLLEQSDAGTTFTRHVQISVSGWMKIMSPMMGMMLPKQNQDFPANLKRALEERSAKIRPA